MVAGNRIRVLSRNLDSKLHHNTSPPASPRLAPSSPVSVHIGSMVHTDPDGHSPATIYEMSSQFAFTGLLSPEQALFLRSVGCACFSLSKCKLSAIYSSALTSCITKSTLCSPHTSMFRQLTESPELLRTQLQVFIPPFLPIPLKSSFQEALLLTIRPSSAHCCLLSKSLLSVGKGNALALYQSPPHPVSIPLVWRTLIAQNRRETTIDRSLRALGGVKLLIFLYALVC